MEVLIWKVLQKLIKLNIEELSDEMLTIVTNEIMDTCLFIGGDFKKENIIDITKQYVTMGGIRRIKKAHEGI